MNVRFATFNDKNQILKLFDEFGILIKAKEIPSKVGGPIYDEIVSRNDTKIFIIEDNNRIVGLATFYLLPNIRHGWKRGHIEDFFVTKTARGKGVGTFLLKSIKDYCRKNNIKVIKLHSGNDLVEAHHFYEKSGGKSTERFFRFDID
jgi:GNAT superfamily N-acetyltransferase